MMDSRGQEAFMRLLPPKIQNVRNWPQSGLILLGDEGANVCVEIKGKFSVLKILCAFNKITTKV